MVKLCWHFSKLFVGSHQTRLAMDQRRFYTTSFLEGEQNIQGNPGDFSVKTRAKAMGFLVRTWPGPWGCVARPCEGVHRARRGWLMVGLILTKILGTSWIIIQDIGEFCSQATSFVF